MTTQTKYLVLDRSASEAEVRAILDKIWEYANAGTDAVSAFEAVSEMPGASLATGPAIVEVAPAEGETT